MANLSREDLEARYEVFDKFALNDQRDYYKSTIAKFRTSASQVNRYRALFAFLTGLSAALAGYIVQVNFLEGSYCTTGAAGVGTSHCQIMQFLLGVFIIGSIAMPALGAFFNTLADLYQWDRLITIYDAAMENIEVADARSPIKEMDDLHYRASLRAFTEGTLLVMSDETAQWGQSIRVPPQLENFIEEEREKAQDLEKKTRLDKAKEADASAKAVVQPQSPSEFDAFEKNLQDQEMAEIARRRQQRLDQLSQAGQELDHNPPPTPPTDPKEPEG